MHAPGTQPARPLMAAPPGQPCSHDLCAARLEKTVKPVCRNSSALARTATGHRQGGGDCTSPRAGFLPHSAPALTAGAPAMLSTSPSTSVVRDHGTPHQANVRECVCACVNVCECARGRVGVPVPEQG